MLKVIMVTLAALMLNGCIVVPFEHGHEGDRRDGGDRNLHTSHDDRKDRQRNRDGDHND
jgi:hypothetical protein